MNRVLREQLHGIRVVRAFVREDVETKRFEQANEEVTDTGLRAGRLFALMFPIVMLVLNVSSVAVIWFGAFRVEDGSMQIGTLIAFLQLPDADPHGGDDGDVHGGDDPARRRVRRPHLRGAQHRLDRRRCRRTRSPS